MSPCPTEGSLRAFLSGAVTAAEEESVGQHLSTCPDCLRKLEEISDTPDPLLGALRGAVPVPASTWAEPAVLEMLGLARVGEVAHVGERVGPYRLLGKIGEGGMGTVYQARHEKLGKVFALKVLSPGRHNDPARTVRFEREMRAVGRLKHPHIVQATDAGEHDGVLFLAMELVDGIDLSRLVRRRGPLRAADACEVVRQAALALEHAHEKGLIHRDVKPSNLLLTPDGTIKLLDLGLALAVEEPEAPAPTPAPADAPTEVAGLTLTGLALGTRDYMAPEQAADPHGVDPRADIYGLGATLHFLVTGKPPGDPTAAPPAALADVLGRMLARRPEERFAAATEVAAAVGRRAAGHDLPALAAGRAPRSARHRRRVAAAVGAVALLVGGVALAAFRGPGAIPNPSPSPGPELAHTPVPPGPELAPPPRPKAPPADPLPVAPRPRPARRGPAPTGGWQMAAAEAAALQRRWAEYLGDEVVVENALGMKLALIPPIVANRAKGPVPPPGRPYRMGVHEVTRGQFRRFVEATGYKTDGETGGALIVVGLNTFRQPGVTWVTPRSNHLTDDHPITHVSWRDAMAFCKWLGQRDGRVYRVPTIAEWYWACRAGSVAGFHGNLFEEKTLATFAWYAGNSDGLPQSVGRLKPNPFGLYDLIGNVGEWVMDRIGPNPPDYRPEEDMTEEVFRMLRGGSYQDRAVSANLLNTTRTDIGGLASTVGSEWNGFRVYCEE